MQIRGAGAGGPMPGFTPARIIGAFPGPVAAVAGRWDGAVPLVGMTATDDEPWAVELYYPIESRPGLTIRTIRPHGEPGGRGRPIEDLPSAAVNFILNYIDVPPDPSASEQAHRDAIIARSSGIRAHAADAEPVLTAINIDGRAYPAVRIDLLECTALEVPWEDQTVLLRGDGRGDQQPEPSDAATAGGDKLVTVIG